MLTKPVQTPNVSTVTKKVSPMKGLTLERFQEFEDAPFLISIDYDDFSTTILDYAMPVHEEKKVPGTFFITTRNVEEQDRIIEGSEGTWGEPVTWGEVRGMKLSGFMDIQNHTHTHLKLGEISKTQMVEQFEKSQDLFVKNGIFPRHISYPYGNFNSETLELVGTYFETARALGSEHYFNTLETIDFTKVGCAVSDGQDVQIIKGRVSNVRNNGGWMDMLFHAIHPDGITDKGRSCTTPTELAEIIDDVISKGGVFGTYDEIVSYYMFKKLGASELHHTGW